MLQIRVWYSNGYRFTEIKYHSFFDLPTRANTLYTLLNKQSFIITHNRRKKWAIVAPDTHFKFSRFHWISRRFRSWCPSRWAIIRLVLCSLTSALLVLIFPCECFLTIRMVTVLSIRNQTLKHIPPAGFFTLTLRNQLRAITGNGIFQDIDSAHSYFQMRGICFRKSCPVSVVEGVCVRANVSHCEENKAAERKTLRFITTRSTHHAGSLEEQSPLSRSV